MFELGCIVHSVIIGIGLGVIDLDFPLARCELGNEDIKG
jgi:hypothetical protein